MRDQFWMTMRSVYLDNAATTPLDPEVLKAMLPYLEGNHGNPSSIHGFGRKTKAAIETSRKNIARHLNCLPSEIYFTSGGTEADNLAVSCAVRDLGLKHAITCRTEHKAVLETLRAYEERGEIRLSYVNMNEQGCVDMAHLEELLQTYDRSFVSLMHANNEIGNLLPMEEVGELCRQYDAVFHSDTVQTMGHYRFDLSGLNVHFITGAAHKFHGPKGTGFLFIRKGITGQALIKGGGQERKMRGGTECVHGVVGLSKAMDMAFDGLEEHQAHVQGLKDYMISLLREAVPGVTFNGTCDTAAKSLYTVLNVHFPPNDKADMFLYTLDLFGIAASGGSACSSGASTGSHVLSAIDVDQMTPNIRFSFSRFTKKEEVEYAVEKLKTLYPVEAV